MLNGSLGAQTLPSEEKTGVQYSILPVFGYNSDVGLVGGGYLQRIDYGMGVEPFLNSTGMEITISTKANLLSRIDHERIMSFGTNIRSRFRFEGTRLLDYNYFGIGNETDFSKSAYQDGQYFYEERLAKFNYWGRRTLLRYGDDAKLDGQLLMTISYANPASRGDDTVFNVTSPPGFEGGWMNQLGLGVIFDNRDNETDPRHGYRFEANMMAAGSWIGSNYGFSSFIAEARTYLSPIRNVVLAQKLEIRHVNGNVPFWEMPAIGHDRGLRGYMLNRFRGESSILHIAEIRTWLFSFYDDSIRIGGQLFMDTGRVFIDGDRFTDLPSGLKQTFGVGGAISFFNPDFIFRSDVAFSEDIYRIYLGLGFAF